MQIIDGLRSAKAEIDAARHGGGTRAALSPSTVAGAALRRDGRRVGSVVEGLATVFTTAELADCEVERHTLVILAADVAGYSRLVEMDDLDAVLRVRRLQRNLLRPATLAHAGWVVDTIGDGMLMAFASVADALRCAVVVQRALRAVEQDTPTDRRLRLRMGVTLDSVLAIDGELQGRAINVAARLAALAEPGEVYLSEAAFEQLGAAAALGCEPLGERCLRNIAAPVRLYRVRPGA